MDQIPPSGLGINKTNVWAKRLSVIGLIIYASLMAMSYPPKIEGVFADADLDFHASFSERLAFTLNAPAMLIAAHIDTVYGTGQWWFKWLAGVLPTFFFWYLAGLWFDRIQLPALQQYHSPRQGFAFRARNRLAWWIVCLAITVLLIIALFELYTLYWSFDMVSVLVLWPAIISALGIRTIWIARRTKK